MNMTEPVPDTRHDAVALDRRDRVRALYAEADTAIAALGPVCALSGRCCRFHEADHTLFLSALEVDLLLADAPPPVRPLDSGATCPWQDAAGRCHARQGRPLGCRVYFCDPGYLPRAPDLSETVIARLKTIADETGFPWEYAPLHHHLSQAVEDRRFPLLAGPHPPSAHAPQTPAPSPLSSPLWLTEARADPFSS